MSPIKAIDGPPCEYCGSVETVQVVPDRHPMSPWECQGCGAVFGTHRTDQGLLKYFQHGPVDKESLRGDPMQDVCARCGKDLSDPEEEKLITDMGQYCADCESEVWTGDM